MAIVLPEPERAPLDEASTADLIKEAALQVRELAQIEVELVKQDVKREVRAASRAAIGASIAAAAALLMLSSVVLVVVLAVGSSVLAAFIFAIAFLVIAGIAAGVAWSLLPKKPLERTKERLQGDVNQLKEHIA